MVADCHATEKEKQGGVNSYRDYLRGASNFGQGEGSFFPKRHHSLTHVTRMPNTRDLLVPRRNTIIRNVGLGMKPVQRGEQKHHRDFIKAENSPRF